MKKLRADKLLYDLKLAPSREKAAALIMAGCVFAGEAKVAKPGQLIDPDARLRVKGEDHPYVSRGGVKLARAIEKFSIDAAGKICMDVGASTGGFTDCLIQNGASRVYAIDAGYGQIAWKIASDPHVVVIERTNIRKLARERISEDIDIAVVDVSFISLSLVLPVVDQFLKRCADIVALIKPQFEVGRELVGKGGIVRDSKLREVAVEKIRSVGEAIGWICEGIVESPILGAKGNKEYLIYFKKGES